MHQLISAILRLPLSLQHFPKNSMILWRKYRERHIEIIEGISLMIKNSLIKKGKTTLDDRSR